MDIMWISLFAVLCAGIGALVAVCMHLTAGSEVQRP